MTKIKICGMRRAEDILYVNRFRPDYVGFILSDGFKRSISSDVFCELLSYLDRGIGRVGVFVNEPTENILKYYADKLDVIQLHGDEDESDISILRRNCSCEIWKAVRARSPGDIEKANALDCDKLLIDSYVKGLVGGTGKAADLRIIENAHITKNFLLAGGLNSENVTAAINRIRPWGVDLSGSVETHGFKDGNKIRKIIDTIRGGTDNG
ncbi:MAG: phosphoribosylanthranilate isomerase [Ruminococcus sp.]|nr:phosphoribosylanthranilate isomerase [Ruminococcus sp.]